MPTNGKELVEEFMTRWNDLEISSTKTIEDVFGIEATVFSVIDDAGGSTSDNCPNIAFCQTVIDALVECRAFPENSYFYKLTYDG